MLPDIARTNPVVPSWVMSDGHGGFVRLPAETIIHKSSPRISFALSTPSTYPGHNPLDINCSSGIVYLTNQRVGKNEPCIHFLESDS